MSLLSTATVWNNQDNTTQTVNQKRQPSIRKTIKLKPYNDLDVQSFDEYSSTEKNYKESTIADVENHNKEKAVRINDLINKITTDNDGNKLANFQPLPNPIMNKRESTSNQQNIHYNSDDILPENPLRNPVPPTGKVSSNLGNLNGYSVEGSSLGNYGNYNNSYTPTNVTYKPTYAKMELGSPSDNKLLEKINYMIHLLEEMQHEKTNNVTEEFILYTFLGVFIIFVVDSFTRVGKYVR